MKEKFKFVLKWPQEKFEKQNQYTQIATIYVQTPVVAYEIICHGGSRMPDADQQKLAILELKMELIKEISKAEFILEKPT
jgi:hypothetical protein